MQTPQVIWTKNANDLKMCCSSAAHSQPLVALHRLLEAEIGGTANFPIPAEVASF